MPDARLEDVSAEARGRWGLSGSSKQEAGKVIRAVRVCRKKGYCG